MRKHLLPCFVLLLAGCMLAAVVGVLRFQEQTTPLMEQLRFQDTEAGIRLRPYHDEETGTDTLYLPAHLTGEEVSVSLFGAVLEGLGEDGTLAGLPMDRDVSLRAVTLFGASEGSFRILSTGGLPTLYIEMEEGALDYLTEDKTHQQDVVATLVDENGTILFRQGSTMSGRGNSSWDNQAKRPFDLSFDTGVTAGELRDVKKLSLLAESADETKLRNSLAYCGAKNLGIPYTTAYVHANLYINGQYAGLYGLATKEGYTSRLRSDGLTAVFEITSNHEKLDFWPSYSRNPIRVLYGSVPAVQAAVEAFETALSARDWEQCGNLLDLDSFARKYAFEEFFGNTDMAYASQFFALGQDGRLRCILPWDYDLSLGATFWYHNNKQLYEIEAYKYADGWYARLLENEDFLYAVTRILREEFSESWMAQLETHLDSTISRIEASVLCDQRRWESFPPFNPYSIGTGAASMEDYRDTLLDYFPRRREILLDYFSDPGGYGLVQFDGDAYGNFCIPLGASLAPYLEDATILEGNAIRPDFTGWRTEEGIAPEDVETVTGDLLFLANYAS